jgi:hypothetical protein
MSQAKFPFTNSRRTFLRSNTEQLAQILPMAGLELSDDELAKLTEAGN